MDTFAPGTIEFDEAHGLYFRGDRALVVSPGEEAPRSRRWERVASLAHPGVAREMAETPAGRAALLNSLDLLHHGVVGQGQGCDIAEFQSSTPSGFDFYIERLLNENNREDTRARMHAANIDAMGKPRGAYGIVRPGGDAVSWANHFADLLDSIGGWAFVPTIDVELGDPGGNRSYVATASQVLRGRGYSVVMGYFSTGGSYRGAVQDLVDRLWGAAWGSGFPAGFDVHQWSGSPLDRDYCPNFARISLGSGPTPAPADDGVSMYSPSQLVDIFKLAQINLIQTDSNYVNTLLSIAAHSPEYIGQAGYENAWNNLANLVKETPITADKTLGDILASYVGQPKAELIKPKPRSAADIMVASRIHDDPDAELAKALARIG